MAETAWQAGAHDVRAGLTTAGELHCRFAVAICFTSVRRATSVLEHPALSVVAPTLGPVVAIPQVGGLHHRYDRRAA